jgi:large subunit ribosomal protein L13
MKNQDKTYATKHADIERGWWVVDAQGKTLGRLATQIAHILRGKHKPYFAPNIDTGDYVIVINAGKFHVTGKRMTDKIYFHHSHYPGGIKSLRLKDQLERHPDRPIHEAVKGMLPKNALGHQMIKKLKIYTGEQHPHEAQQPRPLEELFKKG